MTMIAALERDLIPRTYECGPDGRMRIHDLMKHLQEIASDHAEKMGLGMGWMIKNGRIWVLVDIRMKVDRSPLWNENCTLFTIPSGFDDLRAYREFTLTDRNDQEILKATSVWMVLDIKNKRPIRTEDLDFNFPSKGRRNFDTISRKNSPSNLELVDTIKVCESSIDMNGHVNNTEYVRWSFDGLSLNSRGINRSADLLLSYRSEVFVGNIVEIYTGSEKGSRIVTLKVNGEEGHAFMMEIMS